MMRHSNDLRRSWRCMQCEQITRRSRNDNTPVRRNFEGDMTTTSIDTDMSMDDRFAEDRSILGNTITAETPTRKTTTSSPLINTNCTLEQISQLLDTKLEINKRSTLSELKTMIQTEINSAINTLKQELTHKTGMLFSEQTNIKKDISELNGKMKTMESECHKLKTEINSISERFALKPKPENGADTSKRIVLYGLNEYHRETEAELNDRIINLFGNILNINLLGYIEDLNRIGKKSPRRPIVIELISKRMTKYILQNNRYFRNTGFAVTAFLTGEALQERKELKEEYLNARKSGKRASLRGSKLIIDGKEISRASTSHHMNESQQSQPRNIDMEFYSRPTHNPHINAEIHETFRN
ncbi:jg15839 [Pararge aegeria aegeria]|uniref:Jg15839 protein n=1 Tax=Pararge aegeria aegeria TaxID=348720 RepID=A0A8S4SIV0_9NEOP|nr:jg15839 [Pararge aegeria aegeria]